MKSVCYLQQDVTLTPRQISMGVGGIKI